MKRVSKTGIQVAAVILLALTARGQIDEGRIARHIVRLGTTPDLLSGVNMKDAQIAIQIWTEEVRHKMGVEDYQLELTVFEGLPAAVKAVKARQLDWLGLTGLDFFEIKDEAPLEPALVGIWNEEGKITEEYVLLTHRGRDMEELVHFRDRDLIVGTRDKGRTAKVWLEVLLMREGLPESQDLLRKYRKVDKPSEALLAVFFEQADACIVTRRAFQTMAELNPQVKRELAVLASSPGFLSQVMCVRKDLDAEEKKIVIDTLLKLHTESEGQQLLTLFRSEKAVRFQASHLQNTAALAAEYEGLKAQIVRGR